MKTYTLFEKSLFSPGALVFAGDIDSKKLDVEGRVEPDYDIKLSLRSLELLKEPSSEIKTSLLVGKFKGFFGNSAIIEGYSTVARAKRNGLISRGWSFVDFMCNEFRWYVGFWGWYWILRDMSGTDIAKFTRSKFKYSKTGILTIYGEVSESLLALIIITCRIVFNSGKH